MSQTEEEIPVAKPMRLQRFLAQCGLGSRRDCEELITTGRVAVDGVTISTLGAKVEPSRQSVSLDGEKLKVQRKKYYLLNKPSGFLCTAEDPAGRKRVLDLFPEEGPRLFTVGRLDENTTGLLVVTNDGDLAQKLAHPRYRIFRLYRAQVAGQPPREIFEQLKQGLFFTEGKFRVHDVVPIKKQKDSTWVEITMTEGQNREIRRLFARVGHKIMKLERIGYGPLRLGRLGIGEYRELTRDELADLHAILQRNQETHGNLRVTDRRPPGGGPKTTRSETSGPPRERTSGPSKRPPRGEGPAKRPTRDGESRGRSDRKPAAGGSRERTGEQAGERTRRGPAKPADATRFRGKKPASKRGAARNKTSSRRSGPPRGGRER